MIRLILCILFEVVLKVPLKFDLQIQWNFHRNSKFSILQKTLENIVWKILATLSLPVLRQNILIKLSKYYGWILRVVATSAVRILTMQNQRALAFFELPLSPHVASRYLEVMDHANMILSSLSKQGSMSNLLDMIDTITVAYDRSYICRNHTFQEDMNNLRLLGVTDDDATA